MKTINSTKYQQGLGLTEALIGLLLMTIMGLGIVFITSKNMVTQRYTTTQNLTVLHMREYLQTRSNDNRTFTLAGKSVDMTLAPRVQNITVSLAGGVSPKTLQKEVAIKISASDADLFGTGNEIIISHGAVQ